MGPILTFCLYLGREMNLSPISIADKQAKRQTNRQTEFFRDVCFNVQDGHGNYFKLEITKCENQVVFRAITALRARVG